MPPSIRQENHPEQHEPESELSLLNSKPGMEYPLQVEEKPNHHKISHTNLIHFSTDILNHISSFLGGRNNILKAVCTQLSGKNNRYAWRWALEAYNKSFILPVHDADDSDLTLCCSLDKLTHDENIYITYYTNTTFSMVYALTGIGAVFFINHALSTAACGVGFCAGKIKDHRTQPPHQLLSPIEARKLLSSAPPQLTMNDDTDTRNARGYY
jgi:hypothetical protein